MTSKVLSDENLLRSVVGNYYPEKRILSIEEFESGNINNTYKVNLVDSIETKSFVLQNINNYVFSNPELITQNWKTISDHIQPKLYQPQESFLERRWETPMLIPITNLDKYVCKYSDRFWRAITYIDLSKNYDSVLDPNHAYEIGLALGYFHYLLLDLPNKKLFTSLANFHDTPLLLSSLDSRASNQQTHYRDCVKMRLNYIQKLITKYRPLAFSLKDAISIGELQIRPIHGDPKTNNFMFDVFTNNAIAVIDFDTVQPGIIHYDL